MVRASGRRQIFLPQRHILKVTMMKLTFSPASPFARKVRICAIELGLIDKIELVPATVAPGTPNEAYAHDISPLRKLPALILDDGSVLVDSFVICEYLDHLAGNKLIPASGAARWKVKSEHSMLQMRYCCAATRSCCVPKRCAGRSGTTISGTAPGRVLRGSRLSRMCWHGHSTLRRSRWLARSAMPTSGFPIATSATAFQNSPHSTRKCCSGRR